MDFSIPVDIQEALAELDAFIEAQSILDQQHHMEFSDKFSMCNYRANPLVCNAADRAMQVHAGIGYTRAKHFEHIYRHHRRYRITEGSEELQIRRIAQHLFWLRSLRTPCEVAHV